MSQSVAGFEAFDFENHPVTAANCGTPNCGTPTAYTSTSSHNTVGVKSVARSVFAPQPSIN